MVEQDAAGQAEQRSTKRVKGPLQSRVGKNLQHYRKSLGLTQEGLAEILSVHPKYVGNIEQGVRNLSLRTVERLADKLGIHVRQLLQEVPAEGA